MHTAIYISLNCFYFLFCVLLVNTIKKEFFTQTEKNIIKTNSENIFIPDDRDKNLIYLSQLLKSSVKPKYIFMLPLSDVLVSKTALWSNLRGKFYNNMSYLHNFLLESFMLDNYLDKKMLESLVYGKNQKFPLNLILSNSQKKHILFKLESHLDFYDLISFSRQNKYNMIQRLDSNIFVYKNKILTLESYILIVKEKGTLSMYVNEYIKYLLFDLCKEEYMKTYNVDLILQTKYFEKQYRNIIKNLYKNLKFIYQNLKDYLLNEKILEESVCFELFSVNHFLDSNFNLYLFDINRKINLISDEEKKKYMEIVFHTYNLVRGNSKLEDTNFLEIS